jgi:hypothetical protein
MGDPYNLPPGADAITCLAALRAAGTFPDLTVEALNEVAAGSARILGGAYGTAALVAARAAELKEVVLAAAPYNLVVNAGVHACPSALRASGLHEARSLYHMRLLANGSSRLLQTTPYGGAVARLKNRCVTRSSLGALGVRASSSRDEVTAAIIRGALSVSQADMRGIVDDILVCFRGVWRRYEELEAHRARRIALVIARRIAEPTVSYAMGLDVQNTWPVVAHTAPHRVRVVIRPTYRQGRGTLASLTPVISHAFAVEASVLLGVNVATLPSSLFFE